MQCNTQQVNFRPVLFPVSALSIRTLAQLGKFLTDGLRSGARERWCRCPTGARVAGLRRGPRGFALVSQVELPSWKFRPASKILRSQASFCGTLETKLCRSKHRLPRPGAQ